MPTATTKKSAACKTLSTKSAQKTAQKTPKTANATRTKPAFLPKAAKKRAASLYVVKPSAIAGLGVFAGRAISPGRRILEYRGERITPREADRRYDDASMAEHHTMLFMVNRRVCIDATRKGNDARYINHSCSPNCEAVDYGGRIFIEAVREISPGEELTYDYAYAVDEGLSARVVRKRYPCKCGTRQCRGTLAKRD